MVVIRWFTSPFRPWYQRTDSPYWSSYIYYSASWKSSLWNVNTNCPCCFRYNFESKTLVHGIKEKLTAWSLDLHHVRFWTFQTQSHVDHSLFFCVLPNPLVPSRGWCVASRSFHDGKRSGNEEARALMSSIFDRGASLCQATDIYREFLITNRLNTYNFFYLAIRQGFPDSNWLKKSN